MESSLPHTPSSILPSHLPPGQLESLIVPELEQIEKSPSGFPTQHRNGSKTSMVLQDLPFRTSSAEGLPFRTSHAMQLIPRAQYFESIVLSPEANKADNFGASVKSVLPPGSFETIVLPPEGNKADNFGASVQSPGNFETIVLPPEANKADNFGALVQSPVSFETIVLPPEANKADNFSALVQSPGSFETIVLPPEANKADNFGSSVLPPGTLSLVGLNLNKLQAGADQTSRVPEQPGAEEDGCGDMEDDGVNLVVKGSYWWCKDCDVKGRFGRGQSLEEHLHLKHNVGRGAHGVGSPAETERSTQQPTTQALAQLPEFPGTLHPAGRERLTHEATTQALVQGFGTISQAERERLTHESTTQALVQLQEFPGTLHQAERERLTHESTTQALVQLQEFPETLHQAERERLTHESTTQSLVHEFGTLCGAERERSSQGRTSQAEAGGLLGVSELVTSVYTIPSHSVGGQEQHGDTLIVFEDSGTLQVVARLPEENSFDCGQASETGSSTDCGSGRADITPATRQAAAVVSHLDPSGNLSHPATFSHLKPIPVIPALPPAVDPSDSVPPGQRPVIEQARPTGQSNLSVQSPCDRQPGDSIVEDVELSLKGGSELSAKDSSACGKDSLILTPERSCPGISIQKETAQKKSVEKVTVERAEAVEPGVSSERLKGPSFSKTQIKQTAMKTRARLTGTSTSKTGKREVAKRPEISNIGTKCKTRSSLVSCSGLGRSKRSVSKMPTKKSKRIQQHAIVSNISRSKSSDVQLKPAKERSDCNTSKLNSRTSSRREIRRPLRYLDGSKGDEKEWKAVDDVPAKSFVSKTAADKANKTDLPKPGQRRTDLSSRKRHSPTATTQSHNKSAPRADIKTTAKTSQSGPKKAKADTYACEDCGREFKTQNKLDKHSRLYAGQTLQRCLVCGVTVHNLDLLNVHTYHVHRTHEQTRCLACGRTVGSKRNLLHHLLTHPGPPGQSVSNLVKDACATQACPVCHETLVLGAGRVERHMLTHQRPPVCACQHCGRDFRHKGELYAHLKEHGDARKVQRPIRSKGKVQRRDVDAGSEVRLGDVADGGESIVLPLGMDVESTVQVQVQGIDVESAVQLQDVKVGNMVQLQDIKEGNKLQLQDIQGNKLQLQDVQEGNMVQLQDMKVGNKLQLQHIQEGNKLQLQDIQEGNKVQLLCMDGEEREVEKIDIDDDGPVSYRCSPNKLDGAQRIQSQPVQRIVAQSVQQILKFEESSLKSPSNQIVVTFIPNDSNAAEEEMENPATRKHKTPLDFESFCQKCGKRFRTKKLLYQHLRSHGDAAADPAVSETGSNPSDPETTKWAEREEEEDSARRPIDLSTGVVPPEIPCSLVAAGGGEDMKDPKACGLCQQEFASEGKARRHHARFSEQRTIVQCRQCPRRFHNLDLFNVHHVYSHQGAGVAACMTCDLQFQNKADLLSHLANSPRAHPLSARLGLRTFLQEACGKVACGVCAKSMWNYPINISNHTKTHRSYPCPVCRRAFPYKYCLLVHLQAHTNASNLDLVAALSQRELEQSHPAQLLDKLHELMDRVESDDFVEGGSKFPCSLCGGRVSCRRKNIHKHLDLHARKLLHGVRDGRYFCPHCGEDVAVTEADSHLLAHGVTELTFVCVFCTQVFHTFDEFKEHEAQKHWLNAYFEKSVCEVCGKELVSSHELRKHVKLHGETQGLFRCHLCKQTFRFKSKLREHVSKHDSGLDSYACQFCGKLYMTKISLHRHEQADHLGVKDFKHKCGQCDAQFINATNLRVHVTNKHGAGASYTCPHCGVGFKHLSTFVRHKRVVHGADTPYVCQECGEKFPLRRQLEQHTVLHTGRQPFQCSTCLKSFSVERTLQEHTDFVHRGLVKFQCHNCGGKFPRKRNLVRHLSTCRLRDDSRLRDDNNW